MADKPWYVAFAGSGDTSETNVKELLDDWLPQQIEDMSTAPTPRRGYKGLKNALEWLNKECGDDACGELEVGEIADWLLGHKEAGSEVHLVYIPAEDWDEESDEAKLVRRCIADQIPVHNLAEGLDDFIPPEPTAPEGESKPAEEEQPRTRRRGKPRGEGFDKDTEAARIDAAQEAVAASQTGARDDPPFDTQEAPPAPQAPVAAGVQVMLSPTTIQALLALAGALSEDIKASVIAELPESARPKVQKYPFWVDEDGNYRPVKGRGRPKAGETKAELTIAEMDQLGLEFPA